jgi:hypothetical protein
MGHSTRPVPLYQYSAPHETVQEWMVRLSAGQGAVLPVTCQVCFNMPVLLLQQLQGIMQASGVYQHGSVCAEPAFGTDMQARPGKSHTSTNLVAQTARTAAAELVMSTMSSQQGEEPHRPRGPFAHITT